MVGQLGLDFDRAEYEKSGKLQITAVLPHSPAELAKIKPGEELRAVDGVADGRRTSIWTSSCSTRWTSGWCWISAAGEVTVRPVASLAEQIYRKWVEDNRAYVAKDQQRASWGTSTFATCRSRR